MVAPRVVKISAAQAQVLVHQRGSRARRNVHAVTTYALAMREHRWSLNGVPVIISSAGLLCDGYQRLLACIEAQTSFLTILIRKGEDDAADTLFDCDPPVTCVIETISPTLAKQYLTRGFRERRLSQARIGALAADLASGREMFDAQPICFAHTGRLLKGEHRLQALILAGGAAGIAVIRGLDEAAYPTYALGAKRRAKPGADRIFGDQALAAAMANLLWQHERKTRLIQRAKANAVEIMQILAEHPRLLVLRSLARRMGQYGRASVLGYAAYIMERDDATLAEEFFAILDDRGMQRVGQRMELLGKSLKALRRHKAPPAAQLAMLLTGWERFKLLHSSRAAAEIFRNSGSDGAL